MKSPPCIIHPSLFSARAAVASSCVNQLRAFNPNMVTICPELCGIGWLVDDTVRPDKRVIVPF
jgi:hypothetical protein